MKIREPAVANKFYPGNEKELKDLLLSIQQTEEPSVNTNYAKEKIIGGIVPHAGYIYSGYEAIHFFINIQASPIKFETIIIINPNHNPSKNPLIVDNNTYWKTPLGRSKVDLDFAKKMALPMSDVENKFEHSGEVMVPFLQYMLEYPFQIVPVTMSSQDPENAKNLAKSIFDANNELGKNILIIASSDFSHFVSPKTGNELDQLVLDQIFQLNTQGVYEEILKHNISVCGFGPIMTLMEYSKKVTSKPVFEVLNKGNSAKTFPSKEVVDYISLITYEPDM